MTGLEAIAWADELSPNQYTTEQKVSWLSDLDGKIWLEVLCRYDETGSAPEPYETGEEELLIPAPFARDVYGNWLMARIAESNRELAAYSQYAAAYNAAYRNWGMLYSRDHQMNTGRSWIF